MVIFQPAMWSFTISGMGKKPSLKTKIASLHQEFQVPNMEVLQVGEIP